MDVRTLGRRCAVGNPEQPQQAHDVVDAQQCGHLQVVAQGPPELGVPAPAGDTNRLWTIRKDGVDIGLVARTELDAPVWAAPAFVVECVLGELPTAPIAPPGEHRSEREPSVPAVRHPQYRALPTTPAASFDLALLVPTELSAGTVEEELRRAAGDLLEQLTLFDSFTGAGIPAGMRSIAWRLVFRHPERTLRDKEIDGRRRAILDQLRRSLGIDVRG